MHVESKLRRIAFMIFDRLIVSAAAAAAAADRRTINKSTLTPSPPLMPSPTQRTALPTVHRNLYGNGLPWCRHKKMQYFHWPLEAYYLKMNGVMVGFQLVYPCYLGCISAAFNRPNPFASNECRASQCRLHCLGYTYLTFLKCVNRTQWG